MGFKFWKKETPSVRKDYKIIKKVKKGGKKLDKEQGENNVKPRFYRNFRESSFTGLVGL